MSWSIGLRGILLSLTAYRWRLCSVSSDRLSAAACPPAIPVDGLFMAIQYDMPRANRVQFCFIRLDAVPGIHDKAAEFRRLCRAFVGMPARRLYGQHWVAAVGRRLWGEPPGRGEVPS